MSLTMTGNPIADGIAAFVFWYVLAPFLAYRAGGLLFGLLGLGKPFELLGDGLFQADQWLSRHRDDRRLALAVGFAIMLAASVLSTFLF